MQPVSAMVIERRQHLVDPALQVALRDEPHATRVRQMDATARSHLFAWYLPLPRVGHHALPGVQPFLSAAQPSACAVATCSPVSARACMRITTPLNSRAVAVLRVRKTSSSAA